MIQQQLFSPISQTIENFFSRFPLPQSYVDFLLQNGAGFSEHEKSQRWNQRALFDYALCNGLSGKEGTYFPSILDAAWSPEVTGLPEYFA